jgi:hypothetical protein
LRAFVDEPAGRRLRHTSALPLKIFSAPESRDSRQRNRYRFE